MKVWRRIKNHHADGGINYRLDIHLYEDGRWEQCYVTTADYDGSTDGSEAVVVWGVNKTTVKDMGYKSAEQAVKILNHRFNPNEQFNLM